MNDLLSKTAAVALPFVINLPSSYITRNEVKTWYRTIKKPWFVPPNSIFGPVWTALFATMGYSSYLIWREGGFSSEATKLPLVLYGSQLLLNSAWSIIFFGRHKIGWAAVEISLLWANVLACVVTFRPVSTSASNLMLPYLAWLSLAAALNINTWSLNRKNPSASQ